MADTTASEEIQLITNDPELARRLNDILVAPYQNGAAVPDDSSTIMANAAAHDGPAAQDTATGQTTNGGEPSNVAAQDGTTALADTEQDDDGDEDESGTESDEESEDSDSDDEDDEDEVSCEWEAPGMLYHHKEPSYLGEAPHDGLTDDAFFERVDYEECTPAQLKQFVVDRLLKDPNPKGITLKYYYLRILDKADKEWEFRIMDLPPEIRLEIIRNLLLFSRRHSHASSDTEAFPAILQTCKQIFEEAKGILYDENTISISFTAQTGEEPGSAFTAIVHDKVSEDCCRYHTMCLRIPRAIDDYPQFLRRVARLEVSLQLVTRATTVPAENSLWPLNNFIYSLASFLMDGHRLKTLHLKLDVSSRVKDSDYGKIFYPLRRLRNIDNVKIEGHIPKNIKTKIIEDLTSNEPAFNTMRHWHLILSKLVLQLEIQETIHGGVKCACGTCPLPEGIADIVTRLDNLEELGRESGFSSQHEENFMAYLAGIKNFVDLVKVDDLKNLAEKLVEKSNEMTSYDLVSDDGRLEEAASIWRGKIKDADELKYDPEEDWSADSDGMTVDTTAKSDKPDNVLAYRRSRSPEL